MGGDAVWRDDVLKGVRHRRCLLVGEYVKTACS